MHISEGVLSAPVLVSTGVLGAVLTFYGFYRMKGDMLARTALMSSMFFVGSFIHLPVGPSSVHLVLNGIVGAVLGFCAFPAIFTALVIQALLFQFGGFTTLFTNTFVMGLPALIGYYIFNHGLKHRYLKRNLLFFLTGGVPVLASAVLLSGVLALSGEGFFTAAKALFLMHLFVVAVEGTVSVFLFGFILKVYPDFFGDSYEE